MKTAEEIFESMLADFEESAGFRINSGCDMALRMRAAAEEIAEVYAYAESVRTQCFPQTASGEYLDSHAGMRGIRRMEAAKAVGSITFSVNGTAAVSLSVPAGCVCMTASGMSFETLEEGVIAVGESSCTVAAECMTAGSIGNAAGGTVTYMASAPIGVTACSNEAAFSGGADEESDEELRQRVVSSFRRLPNGANAAYYEQEALAVEGVAAAVVTPRAYGIGTVRVTVAGASGTPSGELLSAVLERLEAAREICVDITVAAPTETVVNITAAVDVKDGYDETDVYARVQAALTAYFTGRLLGQSITRARLGSIIFGVEGVENYSLALPASDVSVSDTGLPVLGTVSIGAWS